MNRIDLEASARPGGCRRRLAGRLAALALCAAPVVLGLAPSSATAQDNYPNRQLRMVVPFSVGGTSDVLGRLIGQALGDALGHQVVIENRPGANGNIGSDLVAKAAPDGYTLLLVADGTMVINPSMYPNLPFDPARDFAPVARVALVPLIIVANPGLAASTPAELVALGRSSPAELFFASAGPGSTGHLAGELLKKRTGMKMSHVAYKGGGQAVTDVVAGQIPLLVTALATAGQFIKDGRQKAVAMTSGNRVAGAPDVPTLAESGAAGTEGFDVASWYGIVAPAGTPEPVVRRLNAELVKILASPQIRERLQALGAEPIGDSPDQFAGVIREDLARWAGIVKDAGIAFK
ncbi:MAG: tripartite tricarboxylate transporter substrate binding protein [Burkholderiaceae bacterium]|nr:tripartite tricarboxylate transporter substrate binding protein [Burkholderiaceae bacterium]